MARVYDAIVVGAGIVGAATAAEVMRRHPGWRVAVLEKEAAPAFHQTGRNSGVIHSGVYYTPGSLKARLCRAGLEETYAFARARGIAVERRGKLLVATDAVELGRLEGLEARAAENGVPVERLSAAELKRHEPAVAGVGALRVPETGIADYTGITRALLGDVEDAGGDVVFSARVEDMQPGTDRVVLRAGGETYEAGCVIGCGGLQADRLARLAGVETDIRIVPFRGEYFTLPARLSDVVRHLIYPIPDPALPFLGVHLTPMVNGTITVGPNAVLSLAREGYTKFAVNPTDTAAALSYGGTWRALAAYPGPTLNELRGWLSKRRYLAEAQKYCPGLSLGDLGGYHCGIRAQALRTDGSLCDDFLIKRAGPVTMVLNAPSPAATSAMPIAREVCDRVFAA
ncbi:MAG: L-2-hydroxyglutarate oxidase [Pseudomonadota bacterium]